MMDYLYLPKPSLLDNLLNISYLLDNFIKSEGLLYLVQNAYVPQFLIDFERRINYIVPNKYFRDGKIYLYGTWVDANSLVGAPLYSDRTHNNGKYQWFINVAYGNPRLREWFINLNHDYFSKLINDNLNLYKYTQTSKCYLDESISLNANDFACLYIDEQTTQEGIETMLYYTQNIYKYIFLDSPTIDERFSFLREYKSCLFLNGLIKKESLELNNLHHLFQAKLVLSESTKIFEKLWFKFQTKPKAIGTKEIYYYHNAFKRYSI